MVALAHSSQASMCRSVPQMDVFVIAISASFGPTPGLLTFCIQMPGSGFAFTNARIS
jgi:hypothetical protein